MPFRFWLLIAVSVLLMIEIIPLWLGIPIFVGLVWFVINGIIDEEEDDGKP